MPGATSALCIPRRAEHLRRSSVGRAGVSNFGHSWHYSPVSDQPLLVAPSRTSAWMLYDMLNRPVEADAIYIAGDHDVYVAGSLAGGGLIWRYPSSLCGNSGTCYSPNCARPAATITPATSNLLAMSGDGTSSVVAAGDNGYVVKTNLAGSTFWKHTLQNVNLKGIAVDQSGYIYVVGETTSSVSTQTGDAFVAKLTP